ncbi:hypothetical protein ACQBAT_04710 [Ornithinimicrobium sp. Y1847]|uniref:hypothetical protein n=1 Tax=unclassified Ornithinimicrobium TaxID=2615080 RepID=UPI003B67BD72
MRWDRLFADLEAQLDGLARAEHAAEVAEHTRAEVGQVELIARLVAAQDYPLRMRVSGLGWIAGRLVDVGDGWLLLEREEATPPTGAHAHGAAPISSTRAARGAELIVPIGALSALEALGSAVDARPAAASRRFGLRHALRAVSRDRAPVRVHDRDGDQVTGTIERVLADHLDLVRHADDQAPRARVARGRVTIPYAALAAVRRL